jgi:hypothetical protein
MNILPVANPSWIHLLKPSKFGIYGDGDTTFFSGGDLLAYVPHLPN